MTFSLLAMVAFGVVAVDNVDKFGFLVAPLVSLVTALRLAALAARLAASASHAW